MKKYKLIDGEATRIYSDTILGNKKDFEGLKTSEDTDLGRKEDMDDF